jgi:ribosome biogenesis GTPase A
MGKKKKSLEIEGIELTEDRVEEKPTITWYPGHMAKALRKVQDKLKMVDIVLEIRDARVPLISGNDRLQKTVSQKNRLIIVNKINLADPEENKKWEAWFEKQEIPYIFINSLDKSSVKKIFSKARELVIKRKMENGANPNLKKKIRMMFIGLPNTGKSTIINRLVGRTVARAADRPGLTQNQQWIVVDNDMELMDTPGIMPPRIKNDEQAFYLCAIHAIKDDIVGEEEVSSFVLNFLLKHRAKELTEKYGLDDFNLTVGEAFEQIGLNRKFLRKKGQVDFDRVFTMILSDFRKGELGRWTFEKI